jgi:hypothetical protein
MKIKNYFRVFLITIVTFSSAQGIAQSLKSPTKQYESDLVINKDGDTLLFNPKMLSLLFADKIGTSFGGSNDLSLQKFYFGIDSDDKSIALGFNIDSRGKEKLEKLKWIFSAALKLKSANNFATIFDGKGKFLNDNIGATYKASYIAGGVINFTSNSDKKRCEAIENNRRKLFEKYDAAAKKFNDESLKTFKKEHNISSPLDADLGTLNEVLKEKHDTAYEELAQEEIDYLLENKMYRFMTNKWVSLEVFTPWGGITNYITSDENTAYVENRFYNITASLSGNYMRAYSSGESYFLKLTAGLKNNNTILANDVSSKTFQTSTAAANNNIIVKNEDVYVTPYEEFATASISFEPTYFFWSNVLGDFGISAELELNFGKYNRTNWKLGFPISLKDKEGKPSINFEFQYKSIKTLDKTVDVFGISSNFLFGDLIK